MVMCMPAEAVFLYMLHLLVKFFMFLWWRHHHVQHLSLIFHFFLLPLYVATVFVYESALLPVLHYSLLPCAILLDTHIIASSLDSYYSFFLLSCIYVLSYCLHILFKFLFK